MRTRRVVGCMTGTSMDGMDCALVEIRGEGLGLSAHPLRTLTRPLLARDGRDLTRELRALASGTPMTAREIAFLSLEFGHVHASVIAELLADERADLICVHGQTVVHAPPLSWQLMNPAPIAHSLRTPVVYDFRAADLAAGGQGAPVTPITDAILFRQAHSTGIVNLGGFCNFTLLPPAPGSCPLTPEWLSNVSAGDVCACNQLLDDLARQLLSTPYDAGGAHALAGTVHEEALEDLTGILAAQGAPPRSLGTGDEAPDWTNRWRAHVNAQDLAATACEALGIVIAGRVRDMESVVLAGGGVKNAGLVRAIRANARCLPTTTDARGIPASHREAISFAVLGALCQDRIPITLPQVTGCDAGSPLAGSWVFP